MRVNSLRPFVISAVILFGAAGATSTTFAQQASAPAESPRSTEHYNISKKSKLAIEGYDPVAYFPEGGGKPAKGNEQVTTTHRGVTYRFVSDANRKKFLAAPEKYEPAYGGWCAWAMREADKTDINPKSFIVKDDRLFLFYNGLLGDTRAMWLKKQHDIEAKGADAAWKKISGEAARMGAPVADGAAKLQPSLDAIWTKASEQMPAERKAAYEKSLAEMAASDITSKAIKVGAKAPDFMLPDAKGSMVSLTSLLAEGPVVMTWYRGGWCPFCNVQLKAYQDSMEEMKALGATLVAISPQTPDNSLSTAEKNSLEFAVLSDVGSTVAASYGVAYKVPDDMKSRLEQSNGAGADSLPVTATYVIDRTGTVAYAFVDTDYRKRAEPSEVLNALRALSDKK